MPFKAAKCPNCAGDLQVPDDRDTVKCMYCGSDIVVREAIKLAGGVNIVNLLMLAKTAEESKNWGEAYKYYSTVLEYEPKNVAAWIGKGKNKVFPVHDNAMHLITCFRNALLHSEQNKAEIKNEMINFIIELLKANYDMAGNINPLFGHLPILEFLDELGVNDKVITFKKNLVNEMTIDRFLSSEVSKVGPDYKERWTIFRSLREKYISQIRSYDKSYQPPSYKKNNAVDKKCFIATAAYGSPLASEVVLLQKFRDNNFITSSFGKGFVKAYYKLSPPIANLISKHDFLRAISRQLLKPVIFTVKKYYRGDKT